MTVEETIRALQELAQNHEQWTRLTEEQRVALVRAAGELSRPSRLEQKQRNKEKKKLLQKARLERDRSARAVTGIRKAREATVFTAPSYAPAFLQQKSGEWPSPQSPLLPAQAQEAQPELQSPRNCYVCKTEFTKLHFFYDTMCGPCADLNYKKRFQTASLEGRVAIITGSRLKIGYQATLMMLRAGAQVVATTRFPKDSALRFSREPDFAEWGQRLQIYGLDLRHTPSVEIFCQFMRQSLPRLDILINNAAQTVRRPPGFYSHLMPIEREKFVSLPAKAQALLRDFENCRSQIRHLGQSAAESAQGSDTSLTVSWHNQGPGVGFIESAELSQIPYSYDNSISVKEVFPEGRLDADLQQVDLRKTNSWRLRLGEVHASEMLEVQLVNSVAPFVLCNELVPLMRRDFTGQKHIVNVTAMEGKFYRFKKEDRHPHTNMAKAALNMLTHTSAASLAEDGIYMNAVDTGWVTDEDPAQLATFKQEVHDFQPPLDIVDGAARVCDPFFDGILTGRHWVGKFLKDYAPIDW
jgi:NAD(P)-dependent dehydrogenase (short-subunit alcohol dehydrogenase family)